MAAESHHVESSLICTMLLLSKGGVSAIENGLTGSWKTVLVAGFMSVVCLTVIVLAWKRKVERRIPGPTGLPIIGSLLEMGGLAHRRLAALAVHHGATSLMAFNLGSNPVVITCKPDVARDLLSSSDFADRPLKESAKLLLFGRAIGFAPYGEYWRNLRRIAATHLFSPNRISAHEEFRQKETTQMLMAIWKSHSQVVEVRSFLQRAALNNIMMTVFGRRYDFGSRSPEAIQLEKMVREGFELLGAFNFADYFPALKIFSRQPGSVHERCRKLVSVVKTYVQSIIEDHRQRKSSTSAAAASNSSDFVDVLISLQEKEKLSDDDMVAILWEMIFRGSDTTAILTEWALAELVLHPHIQSKLQAELDSVVGKSRHPTDSDIQRLPYLQAVVKETLRLHPPGPLLSWARLSRNDTHLAGHFLPRGTTAMVNMWAITHDENLWSRPNDFVPERFMGSEGGQDVDVRGNDLRLAPFGAGRRVCPGRALGLATVHLWLARLVHHFTWVESTDHPVDLSEELKLSCQMVTPLRAGPLKRIDLPF